MGTSVVFIYVTSVFEEVSLVVFELAVVCAVFVGWAAAETPKNKSSRAQKIVFPIQVILTSKETETFYAGLSDEHLIFATS